MTSAEELKKRIRQATKRKKKSAIRTRDLLSSGSTSLNLACTDRYQGAFGKGHYYYFVGDSSSGKTWLGLSLFAEATLNPSFDDYRLIYDNAEDGALMDLKHYFGSAVVDRLEPPGGYDDEQRPVSSEFVEEFYYHLDDAFSAGPFIYVLDSMDALDSIDDEEKFRELKKAHEQGKTDVSGSYGLSKPKLNSTNIRRVVRRLAKTKSILVIISQTRDYIGPGFKSKTRGGGRALEFYSTLEIWTSVAGEIWKTVRGKKRQIGTTVKCRIKKNRVTGKDRIVHVPIYHSFGVDDIGSCIDYLVAEKQWKKSKQSIIAPDFEFQGRRENLITQIENESGERKLARLTGKVWREIEEACEIKRKPRYDRGKRQGR
jgi:RecA/RadA recombinase